MHDVHSAHHVGLQFIWRDQYDDMSRCRFATYDKSLFASNYVVMLPDPTEDVHADVATLCALLPSGLCTSQAMIVHVGIYMIFIVSTCVYQSIYLSLHIYIYIYKYI